MPQLGNGRRRAAFVALIAGATAVLLGSQMVFSLVFRTPNVASAETANLAVDVHHLQALPERASAARAATQMNAAVSTGQFEDLIKVKPTPVPTHAPTAVPTAMPAPTPRPEAYETGVASTYGEGDGFEGNLTACGQVFRTLIVQVAHKSLPCGTVLRIEDANTGRSVIAQVTDRGPYIPGRIVDLSWGAFEQLDPTGPGLLNVSVFILDQ
jgi:rare lipoprotein A (peptidoglycan hydrolase)